MFQSTLIFEPNIPGEENFFFGGGKEGRNRLPLLGFVVYHHYQIACRSVDWRQQRSCVSRCLLPFVMACTQSCSGQQSGAQCRAGSTQTIFLPLPCSSQQSGSTRLAYRIGTPVPLILQEVQFVHIRIGQAVHRRDFGEHKASLHNRHPEFTALFRRFCCSYLLLCPRLPELHQEEEVV